MAEPAPDKLRGKLFQPWGTLRTRSAIANKDKAGCRTTWGPGRAGGSREDALPWLSPVSPPSRWFCVAWAPSSGSGHRALSLNLKQLVRTVLPRNMTCLFYLLAQVPSWAQRKPPQQRSGPRLAQSGPLPWIPRPTWGWEAWVSVASGEGGSWAQDHAALCYLPPAWDHRRDAFGGVTALAVQALYGSPGTPGAHELGMKPSARLWTH